MCSTCNQSCQKAHKIESVKFDNCGYVWSTLFSCDCNFTPKVKPCNHMKTHATTVVKFYACGFMWFTMISCTFCVVSCGNQNLVAWGCCGFMSLTMVSPNFGVEACCRHGFMFHPWCHVDHFYSVSIKCRIPDSRKAHRQK